jgi:DNA-binding NarL/FixJ family response regulator
MIGRAREAESIGRFLERLPTGPVGLVIEGEPGIGKTTVWAAAVRAAEARGYRVLQARPVESEAELSFAALSDLVGGAFDEVRGDLPRPQSHALEVALLRRAADAPTDPRTTATALVGVFQSLGARRPLVIAIDDAHWLDPATRRALEFAVRRLPQRVGVLITSRARSDAATPLNLDRALESERSEHLTLGPLSLEALHRVIDQALTTRLSRPTLIRVAETSGGNPFFAVEIARAIGHGGVALASGDPIPLSRVLRDLVNERLSRLSASAREVSLVSAALSHPTSTNVRTALGSADATAALLEAEEAGILDWDGDRLRFMHPLLASAIYGSVAAGRRRALHRRLAEVVLEPEERARHLARGITAPDERVAQEVEDAAGLAGRRGAPEAAAELYEAACRLTPEPRREELSRRMLGRAEALATAGDLDGAGALAHEVAEGAPTGSLRAQALLLLGSLVTYTGTLEARLAYQERALTEAGNDPTLRVEILLALFEQIAVDAVKAAARATEATNLLRDDGESALLARAQMNLFIGEAILGRGARSELLTEALGIEDRTAGRPLLYPLIWFSWVDDLEATRTRYRLQEAHFRDLGDVIGVAELGEFLAMAEFRAGDWDLAEGLIEDACASLAQFDLRGPATASFADRSMIDAHRGRIDRARRTVDDIVDDERTDLFWRMVSHSAQGAIEFCDGSHEAADRAWTAMRDEARLIGWMDNLDDRSEPDHVEALIALGRLDDARRILDHLEWRGRTLPRPWIDATLPRAQALVLAAQGSLDAALAVLDAAPEIAALPFERARLLLVRGQIERRVNRRLAARESLSAALSTFERLGSPPWEHRARAELERLGLRHRAPDELSATERRIAELTASGMTNRQVAEAAFVSPKTVEANLARVYQKLGIRSRAELGARMAEKPGIGEGQT